MSSLSMTALWQFLSRGSITDTTSFLWCPPPSSQQLSWSTGKTGLVKLKIIPQERWGLVWDLMNWLTEDREATIPTMLAGHWLHSDKAPCLIFLPHRNAGKCFNKNASVIENFHLKIITIFLFNSDTRILIETETFPSRNFSKIFKIMGTLGHWVALVMILYLECLFEIYFRVIIVIILLWVQRSISSCSNQHSLHYISLSPAISRNKNFKFSSSRQLFKQNTQNCHHHLKYLSHSAQERGGDGRNHCWVGRVSVWLYYCELRLDIKRYFYSLVLHCLKNILDNQP